MSRFPQLPDRTRPLQQLAQEDYNYQQIARTRRFKTALTPSQVSANSQSDEVVTMTCSSDDEVLITYPKQPQGIQVSARVTDRNEVTVTFDNVTSGALTPTSGNYYVRVLR